MTDNNRNYPICNPASSLEEFLVRRSKYIASIDQDKYRSFILKTQKENDFLWDIHDDMAFLVNFDLLIDIQRAITQSSEFGVSVLKILIPLSRKIDLGNQSELNFIERSRYGK
ncbi:hypothetical protein [Marinilabilia salmonicolor]|uniref:hypothetical protein n=1 Tax=Marinilabilia salmonicolor TaxID=989 RepID=UPI000299EEFB|nr:hypothetical protein [Marinilabilia salmonicolor]